jgi:hypothetical protein
MIKRKMFQMKKWIALVTSIVVVFNVVRKISGGEAFAADLFVVVVVVVVVCFFVFSGGEYFGNESI